MLTQFRPLISMCAVASGCGIAAKVNARNDTEASKAAYKACLAQNAPSPAASEGAHLAYEADVKAYRATSAGIKPGRSDTIDITTTTDR
jgi:hypothetical protein